MPFTSGFSPFPASFPSTVSAVPTPDSPSIASSCTEFFPFTLSTRRIINGEVRSRLILSTDSFTKGCYSLFSQHSTHIHQLTHTPSFIHILYQTLAHKVHKHSRPLPSRKGRRILRKQLHHHMHSIAATVRIPSLRHLNQRDSKGPDITLCHMLLLEHFGSLVEQRITLNSSFVATFIQKRVQGVIRQNYDALFRKEEIVRFNVLSNSHILRSLPCE